MTGSMQELRYLPDIETCYFFIRTGVWHHDVPNPGIPWTLSSPTSFDYERTRWDEYNIIIYDEILRVDELVSSEFNQNRVEWDARGAPLKVELWTINGRKMEAFAILPDP